MGDEILGVKDLTKEFGSLRAVNEVSLSFDSDEVCALIGPNGAGKTTTLNLLTGSIQPTSGEIVFQGTNITDAPPYHIAELGLIKSFQTTNIFNGSTVRENVRIAAQADESQLNFWSAADGLTHVNERTEKVLKQFDLLDIADANVGELSHGEGRMVEMAVTAATDPDMIMLDEPSSGMSSSETDEVVEKLGELSEEIPMVVVEHNIQIVREVADRIVVLHNGEVIADGQYDDVRDNEQVRRVYLGEVT